jgi:hypothetical protein
MSRISCAVRLDVPGEGSAVRRVGAQMAVVSVTVGPSSSRPGRSSWRVQPAATEAERDAVAWSRGATRTSHLRVIFIFSHTHYLHLRKLTRPSGASPAARGPGRFVHSAGLTFTLVTAGRRVGSVPDERNEPKAAKSVVERRHPGPESFRDSCCSQSMTVGLSCSGVTTASRGLATIRER